MNLLWFNANKKIESTFVVKDTNEKVTSNPLNPFITAIIIVIIVFKTATGV